MSTEFYVYHHPSATGKTFDQAIAEKILIGTRTGGPHHTVNFTWDISPFKFMSEYYGEFWWIIDEYGHAMPCYSFARNMAECKIVTYEQHQAEGSSSPAKEASELDEFDEDHPIQSYAW